MHLHDQDLLIVGAVEDPNVPALRQAAHRVPQIVMVQLLGPRMLEAVDLAALRIHARHHVLDGAVLARGIHGLKDHQ